MHSSSPTTRMTRSGQLAVADALRSENTKPAYSVVWVNHFAAPPNESGGTRHFEIGRELVKRNVRVCIVASDFLLLSRSYSRRQNARDRRLIAEKIDGVTFAWVWASPYVSSTIARLLNWLSFARGVVRENLDAQRPDVIIGSSPHLFAALAASRLATRLRVPFILEVRDLWPESLAAVTGRKGVGYHLFGALARHLYKRADHIMVLARGTATYLEQIGIRADRIFFVPNGVDLESFNEGHASNHSGFTALYAGAHGPANGLDIVLEAAALLRARTDIRIVLVGDGPVKKALQETAMRGDLTNVEFRSPVPKRQMPQLLSEADAGLMVLKDAPLFSFGVSPNKLFDYLGASLPVICNVPGDVADILRESGAGEQAADSSPRALAEAVTRMADRTPAERALMGSAGREWVAREHSRPVLAQRLDSVLRSAVRR
ncbi:MAG TPA: glycosyltransferase family 4 protein [Gemmatimonadaceae bacterium]|nr:glycosyltransferase family 4 protein [Gemmatimonadaceae bacterium]